MKITIDLNEIKTSDDGWNEPIAKAVETLTGRKFTDVVKDAQENAKSDIPDGNPSEWNRLDKIAFIGEHGREKFKRLVDERK